MSIEQRRAIDEKIDNVTDFATLQAALFRSSALRSLELKTILPTMFAKSLVFSKVVV